MLKGRRSSTPSQKEKEKSSEKVTKKQQRSVSTSAIKGNNSAAANLTSLSFSSYTTQNDSQDNSINNNNNNSSNGNNGHAVENGDHGHWIDHVCETVVLVLNESGGLHFEVGGGADEGKFPFVGRQRMKPEEAGISVQSLSQNGEISGKPQIQGFRGQPVLIQLKLLRKFFLTARDTFIDYFNSSKDTK